MIVALKYRHSKLSCEYWRKVRLVPSLAAWGNGKTGREVINLLAAFNLG